MYKNTWIKFCENNMFESKYIKTNYQLTCVELQHVNLLILNHIGKLT